MGSCLEGILHINITKQVTPKHESLLQGSTSKELSLFLHESTENDQRFYCATNLRAMEGFIEKFYQSFEVGNAIGDRSIDRQMIKKNMNIVERYLRDMRDDKSKIRERFRFDAEKIQRFKQKYSSSHLSTNKEKSLSKTAEDDNDRQRIQKTKRFYDSTPILINIELQILIPVSPSFFLDLNHTTTDQTRLFLEVFHQDGLDQQCQQIFSSELRRSHHVKNYEGTIKKGFTSEHYESETKKGLKVQRDQDRKYKDNYGNVGSPEKLKGGHQYQFQQKNMNFKKKESQQLMKTTQKSNKGKEEVNDKRKGKNNSSHKKQKIPTEFSKKQEKEEEEIEKIPIFHMIQQIMRKSDKILIKIIKIKNNNKQSSKIELAKLTLDLNDFIFHSSVMVSDVIPFAQLHNQASPQQNSVSKGNQNSRVYKYSEQNEDQYNNLHKYGYLSIRGQCFCCDSFQEDYLRIIKHHESILRQLELILEGEKGWQKLSEYKNSNQSKRSLSVYSQYQNSLEKKGEKKIQ